MPMEQNEKKMVSGFIIGALLGWEHQKDPRGFWLMVGWLWALAACFLLWGVFFWDSIPSDAKVVQTVLAIPGVLFALLRLGALAKRL